MDKRTFLALSLGTLATTTHCFTWPAFQCSDDEHCSLKASGQCIEHACAYPDETCPDTQLRYADANQDQCVTVLSPGLEFSTSTGPETADNSADESSDPTTTDSPNETTTGGDVNACIDGQVDPEELCWLVQSPTTTYAVDGVPLVLKRGDFDADGQLDLVILNEPGTSFAAFLGRPNGIFEHKTILTGPDAIDLVVDDLDLDGLDDIAIISSPTEDEDGEIQVFFGPLTGTPTVINVPAPLAITSVERSFDNTMSLICVSADNDDLLFEVNVENDQSIALNQAYLVLFELDSPAPQLFSGALNGTTRDDLLIVQPDEDEVGVIFDAVSTGSILTDYEPLLLTDPPSTAAVVDIDGDGDTDIVVAIEQNVLVGFTQDDDGEFGAPTPLFQSQIQPEHISHGDIDRNGDIDIIVTSHTEGMEIWLNDNGHFTAMTHGPSPNGLGEVILDDFNGDAAVDAAWVDDDTLQLEIRIATP